MRLFPSVEKKIELLTRLRLLNIKKVRVEFSGGGDSGEVESIDATDSNGNRVDIEEENIVWEEAVSRNVDNEWRQEMELQLKSLCSVLERIVYDWLEEENIDWYNNDGGQGQMTIDFNESPPKFEMYVGVNHVETDENVFEASEDSEWGVA